MSLTESASTDTLGRVTARLGELRKTMRSRAEQQSGTASLCLRAGPNSSPTPIVVAPRSPARAGIRLREAALAQTGERQIELLRASVAALRSTPATLELALSQTELGAALRRANRRAEARQPLSRALDLASRFGHAQLAERARTELRAAGARPRRDRRSGIDALTPCEERIAHMAAAGLSNRQIAQRLFVTIRTVTTHLTHVYQKLEIGGRREIASALAKDDRTQPGGATAAVTTPRAGGVREPERPADTVA